MLIERRDRPLVFALLAIAFSLILTIHISSAENLPSKDSAAHQQSQNIGDKAVSWLFGWDADDTIALLTFVIAGIGFFQWHHFRASERAYMLMSHKSGLEIDGQTIRITMQIRNWGKTPGTVTDNVLGPVFFTGRGKLPPNPDYKLTRTPNPEAFLAPSGKLEWTQEFDIGSPDLSEVIAGRVTLIMFGYVDYRDQFGGRYRNGYAREYGDVLTPEGNNLGFVRDVRGYNYDRPRRRWEGNDWNEPNPSAAQ
jgi:hypothetical protein